MVDDAKQKAGGEYHFKFPAPDGYTTCRAELHNYDPQYQAGPSDVTLNARIGRRALPRLGEKRPVDRQGLKHSSAAPENLSVKFANLRHAVRVGPTGLDRVRSLSQFTGNILDLPNA